MSEVKREFWLYKEGSNLIAYTAPSNLFPDNEIHVVSMSWHLQEMERAMAVIEQTEGNRDYWRKEYEALKELALFRGSK